MNSGNSYRNININLVYNYNSMIIVPIVAMSTFNEKESTKQNREMGVSKVQQILLGRQTARCHLPHQQKAELLRKDATFVLYSIK